MPCLIITSPLNHVHNTGAGHPENSERLAALSDLFQSAPFCDWEQSQSSAAALEQIEYAHSEDYIFSLQDLTPDAGLTYLDGDTILSPQSYDAALCAAGAVCNSVDYVLGNDSPTPHRAFCAVRPPGHHAEIDRAMGFCLFNNIFVGARHTQEKWGVQKVAILDFDVHHGNGTQNMTKAHNAQNKNIDKPIFYLSTHAYPLFPMSGIAEDNDDLTLNHHLPPQCSGAEFRAIYESHILPALADFKPDLLMLSSGFDAHKDDPLATMNLQDSDYGWLSDRIVTQHPSIPLISVLEGGYHIPSLTRCVAAHLNALGK